MNIPKSLKDSLHAEKVIPFVGAGVSRAVQDIETGESLFPNWKELLTKAADRLDEEGEIRHAPLVRALVNYGGGSEYLSAAEYARKGLRGNWFIFLREQLDPDRERADNLSLRLAECVWHLGSNLVITTNYDRVLHWVCPDKDNLSSWYIQAAAEQQNVLSQGVQRPTVWHLHGYVDDLANIILTPDGYSLLYPEAGKAEDQYEAALTTLRNMLISKHFLFIGFSLDDPYFGMQLQGIDAVFQNTTGPHYALVRKADLEKFDAHKEGKELPVIAIPFEEHGAPLMDLLENLSDLHRASSRTDELMVLGIREPGLEIYLTGKTVGWGKRAKLRYTKTAPQGYLLNFNRGDFGDEEFKHFVVCDETDTGRIKEMLTQEGFSVTGDGSKDNESGRWRIWFLSPHYAFTERGNNRW